MSYDPFGAGEGAVYAERSLPGSRVTTHVVRSSIAAPADPDDPLIQEIMGLSRKSALAGGSRGPSGETFDATRLLILRGCQRAVERYAGGGRVIWRGAGGVARAVTSLVDVDRPVDPIPIGGAYPDALGVDVTLTSVERWNEVDAWETLTAVDDYKLSGADAVRVYRRGRYRVVASLLPDEPVEPEPIEACGRLFSYRERIRAGESIGGDGDVTRSATGAFVYSGAAQILDGWRPLRVIA